MDYNSYSLTTVMEEMSTIGPGEACNYTHSYCIKDMKESDVSVHWYMVVNPIERAIIRRSISAVFIRRWSMFCCLFNTILIMLYWTVVLLPF